MADYGLFQHQQSRFIDISSSEMLFSSQKLTPVGDKEAVCLSCYLLKCCISWLGGLGCLCLPLGAFFPLKYLLIQHKRR